ncbi:hypothetical protein GSI_04675 [Ganoderma sinense ZZ0214-1]|uniref:Uncharacterized protein n=1 Tax=Ganoderma sinense ZZ0214-1 TaxID=1077348 RepID=A0A2G8SHH3_9APHY|nr:hypothetical protein GSI_04675 [Ganoderma sinense ZZ0214-1]
MSTTSNAAQGKGTSNEAATTPSLPDITLGEPLDLEASGELLDPHSLPLADPEPVPTRGGRPPSRPDATEVALGVKWGLTDYGKLMEGRSGRRVTRNTAQTVWSGESASAAPAGTYRGHRGPRLLQSVPLELMAARPEASQDGSDPKMVSRLPVETRLEGAGDHEDMRHDGSLLEDTDERCDGRLLEIKRRDGCHLTQSDERREGSLPDESDQRRKGSSGDRISPDLPGLEIGEWRGTDGTVVRTYINPRIMQYIKDVKAPHRMPAWSELCDSSDQLGPLPAEWFPPSTSGETPVLPDTVYHDANASFEDEFWQEVEEHATAAEENNLRHAIAASLSTAEADFAKCQQADTDHLDVNAIVVEVPETVEYLEGHDGHYTAGQKQKHIPRATPQREFLQTFVGGNPTVRVTSEPCQPPMMSTPRRHQTPASYKWDASQVPDSRWNATAAGGGRGGGSGGGRNGGRTPPDSLDSSSSDDSESEGSPSEPDDPDSDVPASPPRSKSPSKKRHRKKQQEDRRELRKILKCISLKPPAKWDGTPDLDKFDHWKYELNVMNVPFGAYLGVSVSFSGQFTSHVVPMICHEQALRATYIVPAKCQA